MHIETRKRSSSQDVVWLQVWCRSDRLAIVQTRWAEMNQTDRCYLVWYHDEQCVQSVCIPILKSDCKSSGLSTLRPQKHAPFIELLLAQSPSVVPSNPNSVQAAPSQVIKPSGGINRRDGRMTVQISKDTLLMLKKRTFDPKHFLTATDWLVVWSVERKAWACNISCLRYQVMEMRTKPPMSGPVWTLSLLNVAAEPLLVWCSWSPFPVELKLCPSAMIVDLSQPVIIHCDMESWPRG